MTAHVVFASALAIAGLSFQQSVAQPPAKPALEIPKTTATTPSGCAQEVRDYGAKKQQELLADLPPAPPPLQPGQQRSPEQLQLLQMRSTRTMAAAQQVAPVRLAMTKDCASRFTLAGAAASELPALAQLYLDAGMPAEAAKVTEAMLSAKSDTPAARAAVLSSAIPAILREPKTDERNARLEKLVDELDAIPGEFERKLAAHQSMNGYYRYDDIDAGIAKHSSWLIKAAKEFTPDQRKRYGSTAVSAHINMAEVLAGQGMNDAALELLHVAKRDWAADFPTVDARVDPILKRYELVGTNAAPISAPRWLNMPAGKTELDMKGYVTLLEFSAHWCVPCKESYPGVNRLREKYGKQGFRAVLATQFYGYFQTERPLTPEVEFERDRTYFAEHGLDIPIAVNDGGSGQTVNDKNYLVSGIPQIQLIDKRGKIRLIMIGYDDANEAKLAKIIEGLLKEK